MCEMLNLKLLLKSVDPGTISSPLSKWTCSIKFLGKIREVFHIIELFGF